MKKNNSDMKQLLMLASSALLLAACANQEKEYDATGTFEATELIVSAQQSGTLLQLSVEEGDSVIQAHEVGLIDTTQLWLKMEQLRANRLVIGSQKPDLQKQVAATRQQLLKARHEQQRYQELVADGAAPGKMLDDATSQVQVLQRQLDALTSTLNTQLSTLSSQQCHIMAPITGNVLEKYAQQGEFVATGKPLFKLADTHHMFLRAYITSAQLQNVRVGQRVKVFADYGRQQLKEYAGVVSWISSQSEFTPKTILTDDERADLVYAVKVAVENDGYVKIGMYGELKF